MTSDVLLQVIVFSKQFRKETLKKGAGEDVTGKSNLSAITMSYPNNSVSSDSNLLR